MDQLRRDPIVGRWVIVKTENPLSPEDFDLELPPREKKDACPFCYGREKVTPPEIYALRKHATRPNTQGWLVRVVPNKFPALAIGGNLDRRGVGLYDMSRGVGAHEIIIETPEHDKDLAELSVEEIERVLQVYRERSLDLRRDKRFKYILIFKNHGLTAGASLRHSHSQLIALPMVPKNVNEELKGAGIYFEYKERCVFCDIIQQELSEKRRLIDENEAFLSFAPFCSRFAFETWIIPGQHQARFLSIEESGLHSLAEILKYTLVRMKRILKGPDYNFIIHTSPLQEPARDDYHWHIEIMPRLMPTAGFEWGTGFYINPTPPELAAEYYRGKK
jgi:UDPglucose--hexose-1-phosphate uridylyltransferase